MSSDGQQSGLSTWSAPQLVETADRDSTSEGVRCPDCHRDVARTKGGQDLPNELYPGATKTFGWRCSDCNNIMPCRAFNPEADPFNDKWRGAEADFRDGHRRFIPVPTREVTNS